MVIKNYSVTYKYSLIEYKSREFKGFLSFGSKLEYLYMNSAEWIELLLYLESGNKNAYCFFVNNINL